MEEPKLQDLLNRVYYGTLRQITEDLIKQVEDLDSYFKHNKEKETEEDKQEKKHILSVLLPVIETYCGEGGIPLESTEFELFVRKYFPEIIKTLRHGN